MWIHLFFFFSLVLTFGKFAHINVYNHHIHSSCSCFGKWESWESFTGVSWMGCEKLLYSVLLMFPSFWHLLVMFIPERGQVNLVMDSNILLGAYFGLFSTMSLSFLSFWNVLALYKDSGLICDGGLGKYPYICWEEVGIRPGQLLKAFDFWQHRPVICASTYATLQTKAEKGEVGGMWPLVTRKGLCNLFGISKILAVWLCGYMCGNGYKTDKWAIMNKNRSVFRLWLYETKQKLDSEGEESQCDNTKPRWNVWSFFIMLL